MAGIKPAMTSIERSWKPTSCSKALSLARGLEHRGVEGRAGLLAGPNHELEGREIALAGVQRAGQQRLALLAGRLDAAGKHQRMAEHHHAVGGPEVEVPDPQLLV